MHEEDLTDPTQISTAGRQALIQSTGFKWRFVVDQYNKLQQLLAFVVSRRLGKNGPRPFGSNRRVSKDTAEGQGARMCKTTRRHGAW